MQLYSRENYLKKIRGFYHADDIIKVITGVRRCGKSSLMQTIADELKQGGVADSNIIYIDLDKRGYKNIKTADALEKEIEKQGTADGLKYLFVDEVQNVTGFEDVLNGFRTEGDWSIFVTGSNSYLLSGEITTKLTGRFLEIELFTLSFEEYEDMKRFYGKPVDANPMVELNSYILEGGFPRTVLLDTLADKRRYVQSVTQEIFEKDIRHRVKIRDRETFETVRRFVINNFGSMTSLTNLCEALRADGTRVTKETVARYVQTLIDAKILYACPRFDMKSKKSLHGDKKYYLSDLSFYYADNTDNQINYGPVLENIVFIYAKTLDCSVSVGRFGKFECDFILRNTDMDYAYVQVAYTIALSKETENREYRPLETVKDNYPKYVLTTDYLLQHRNGIRHMNLLDFIRSGNRF
ncbi:MAG: ATP-binding protein [Clostridiales bacterium]|nr:ATP-binding protein [Clostridiales bacterium]